MTNDIDGDLEEADTTALLAGIYAELQRMRQIMEMDAFGEPLDMKAESESETMYSCDKCGEQVEHDERTAHLQSSHNAPPKITEAMLERYFHEV